MMHLFINSLAASAGGGLTYIRNLLPQLASRPDLQMTVALNSGVRQEFCLPTNVNFLQMDLAPTRRYWFEQVKLPGIIARAGADILISTGNFALKYSPIPQILLSRNSIYGSADYYRDLLSRREYLSWLDTRLRAILARKSVGWADVTVAPSEAFAADLRRSSGGRLIAIHHGFDREIFMRESSPLSTEVQTKLQAAEGCLNLLFVSHYNYYRNFETLIRALPLLRDDLKDRPIKLLLTCHLADGKNPGNYHPGEVSELIRNLGVSDMLVELGEIPYQQLHLLYARADIYVTPAYTETFAHPLVEAMASGVPVVASDLAVHREICGHAAAYFSKFSPQALAQTVAKVAMSAETAKCMARAGLERSEHFSWKAHAESLVQLAGSLIGRQHNQKSEKLATLPKTEAESLIRRRTL